MRESGILLHPTSLPSQYGIGDLGPSAYAFIDWLVEAGQRYWQILPLGPVDGYGSPYSSVSAFAGNELLISPELLVEEGLLPLSALNDGEIPRAAVDSPVHYQTVANAKRKLLQHAFSMSGFDRSEGNHPLWEHFARFCSEEAWWLKVYAAYQSLAEMFPGIPWAEWHLKAPGIPLEMLRRGEFDPLGKDLPEVLQKNYRFHCFVQFLFCRQWDALHRYAATHGIKIFGDVPIYVSYHSADVWAHPQYFFLDDDYRPIEVAGVPPDYFNATGQLWGNPVYRWDALCRDGYRWWIERFHSVFERVDLARVDHFRGFAAYWSVPAGHPTAEHGKWVPGPGAHFFEVLLKSWEGPWRETAANTRTLPIVAEDLGHITPDVIALRRMFGFPGMAVLQFAFGPAKVDQFLPDKVAPDTVMYSGTHDNDTSLGWFQHEVRGDPALLARLRQYCRAEPDSISWDMIELAFQSRSEIAIVPLQDVLGLGSDARMNIPGTPSNNWRWRFSPASLTKALAERLRQVTEKTGRIAISQPAAASSPQSR